MNAEEQLKYVMRYHELARNEALVHPEYLRWVDQHLCGWISVKDQLPVDDTLVLAIMAKFGDIRKASSIELMYYRIRPDSTRYWELKETKLGTDAENNPDYWMVTHWQPIPEYPEV